MSNEWQRQIYALSNAVSRVYEIRREIERYGLREESAVLTETAARLNEIKHELMKKVRV